MGVPVFWTSASSDPPWNFKIWLDQFMLAVMVKENVNPEILLEEPKEFIDELTPRPENPGKTEDAQAVADRESRHRLRRDKVTLENQKRRERGPKVGHNVFYNEVPKTTYNSFIPGARHRREKEISKLEFRNMVRLA